MDRLREVYGAAATRDLLLILELADETDHAGLLMLYERGPPGRPDADMLWMDVSRDL